MKLGILSDTHDNLPRIAGAVEFFNAFRVDFVIHAGDFVAPFTIGILTRLACDWAGVFGNNDGEREGLSRSSGGRIKSPPLRLTLAGTKITVVHDIAVIDPSREDAALIVYGHSHKPGITADNGRMLVNPGECSGWLSGKSTVAVVDLPQLTAAIHTF